MQVVLYNGRKTAEVVRSSSIKPDYMKENTG